MQIGMIGLGRMGANMVRRLLRDGHECVVFDQNLDHAAKLAKEGAISAGSLHDPGAELTPPRAVWLTVPAAADETVRNLCAQLQENDIIADGGNSYYIDAFRRSEELKPRGIYYIDIGASGGVWGLERGFCLMIGGQIESAGTWIRSSRRSPRGAAAFPARPDVSILPAPLRKATCIAVLLAQVISKMVHTGIEYGLMAAYAEGFNILRHANVSKSSRVTSAETTPLRNPERYQYELNLADVAEVWRRGSVVASWLLDLTTIALFRQPDLSQFSGRVSDSGEGRWTITAAIEEGAPAPILSAALYQRFTSRGQEDFGNTLLSAMRFEFGGPYRDEVIRSSDLPRCTRAARDQDQGIGVSRIPQSIDLMKKETFRV
jgi:6-phosphogluconate dehydrogenase